MIKQIISKYYQFIPKILLKKFLTPRNLVIEPVAGCNVICSSCPQDQLRRSYGLLHLQQFKEIVNKTKPRSIGLYFMGEPFLNPEIFEMIEFAHDKGIKTTVSTNGSTLIKDYERIANSSLDKIAISVDGISQDVFEAYRHGINAEQVLEGLKNLTMMKSQGNGPHVQVRTLAFQNTMKELDEIKQAIKNMNINDHRVIEPIITGWGGKINPDLDKLGYVGRKKNTKPKVCPSLFRMAITWDGMVLPCCTDVHGENKFGNIYNSTYESIMWGSDMWRKKAMRDFTICEICYDGD